YTYSIPFAQRELLSKFKKDEISKRLEEFFSKLNNWGRSPYLWIGNQPGYGTPWIYYWLGEPEKTQDVLNRILNETFTDGPEGLPGNDDLGSTSSWYIFASMGLYPGIPGFGGFLVGKPIYPKVSITLPNGKILELDNANGASSDLYLHEVLFEGTSLDSTWMPWETLKNGGKLSFKVGDKSSLWGTNPKSYPPSYGDFILKN
ncbi:MAG: glycoside hydrolase domain-containing protein, partial [Bacteriovoracales bacterium]